MAALQPTADEHIAFRVDAVHLKYRLGDVETDGCDRLHAWLLRIVGALTAPTSLALMCRWGSRPQHQKRALRCRWIKRQVIVATTEPLERIPLP
jgi:hypothetical protein